MFLVLSLHISYLCDLCRDKEHKRPPAVALLVIGLTPLYLGDWKSDIQQMCVFALKCWGLIESIVLSILLWTFTDVFNYREEWIFVIAVFAVIGGLSKMPIAFGLTWMSHDDTQWVRADLKQLFNGKQWEELSEVILFKMGSLSTACNAIFVELLSDRQCTFYHFCSHFIVYVVICSVSEPQ